MDHENIIQVPESKANRPTLACYLKLSIDALPIGDCMIHDVDHGWCDGGVAKLLRGSRIKWRRNPWI